MKQLLVAPRWFALFVPFAKQRPCLFQRQAELDGQYARDAKRPIVPVLPGNRAFDVREISPRPPYSVLDTTKLTEAGISPWRDTPSCLDDFCQRIRATVPALA